MSDHKYSCSTIVVITKYVYYILFYNFFITFSLVYIVRLKRIISVHRFNSLRCNNT